MAGQKSFAGRLFWFCIWALLIFFAIFGAYKGYQYLFVPPSVENDTATPPEVTVPPPKPEPPINNPFPWKAILIWLFVISLAALALFLVYKLLKNRGLKLPNREKCCIVAHEYLTRIGYSLKPIEQKNNQDGREVWWFPYNGADDPKYPCAVIGFLKAGVKKTKTYWEKYDYICCGFDRREMEPFHEQKNIKPEDFLKFLNDQRFGRRAVPNFPGKTEREPGIEDLFNPEKKPDVSLTLHPAATEEEG